MAAKKSKAKKKKRVSNATRLRDIWAAQEEFNQRLTALETRIGLFEKMRRVK